MTTDNDVDKKGERGGDTGPTKKQGKGSGSEKGDARRENRAHTGQTRNAPAARRSENDEQGGQRNTD